jgi:hypothetical protein
MAMTGDIPITKEDVQVNAGRKSVQLSAEKFRELIHYVDQLESALRLAELDLSRERHSSEFLIRRVREAYKLLDRLSSFYGDWPRAEYYDLRAETAREIDSQLESGDITEEEHERLMSVLRTKAGRNGAAEGGVSG